jgi:hypothetical protein
MMQFLKMTAAPAALCAMAFVAMATPAAAASPKAAAAPKIDYCRTDVTAGTRSCGFASLEQCQAMSAGRGGGCFENPFPSGGTSSSSAFAYQPKQQGSKSAKKPVQNQ